MNVANGNGNDSALAGMGDGGTGGDAPAVDTGRNRDRSFLQGEAVARKFRDRGLILELGSDPDTVAYRRFTVDVQPPRPDELDELKRFKPQLLAFLKGQSVAAPAGENSSGPGEARCRAAPAVAADVQARTRRLVDQLPGNADPTIEAAVCRALADAFRDHKPESTRTFLELAGDVRRGGLPAGCLLDAFEAACGKTIRIRGAKFIAEVKRWLKRRR